MLGHLRRSVYVLSKPVDMRKSYDGLFALVGDQKPLEGDVFLFLSRDRRRAKALFWDGSGFNIWMKRLEKGVFADVWRRDRLTPSELQLFFEGASEVKKPLAPADQTHRYQMRKATHFELAKS
jgi:transposase